MIKTALEVFGTNNKYDVILADPPWPYADIGCNGSAEKHYKTTSMPELMELPVYDLAADNCVLFMWVTWPMLQEALMLGRHWGFEYKTIGFVWLKLNKVNGKPFYGLGRYTRGNTEPLIIFTRGKPKRDSKSVFQIIETETPIEFDEKILAEPIGRHSAKPKIVHDKIVELMGKDRKYMELFARDLSEGWTGWGNEIW